MATSRHEGPCCVLGNGSRKWSRNIGSSPRVHCVLSSLKGHSLSESHKALGIILWQMCRLPREIGNLISLSFLPCSRYLYFQCQQGQLPLGDVAWRKLSRFDAKSSCQDLFSGLLSLAMNHLLRHRRDSRKNPICTLYKGGGWVSSSLC